MQIIITKYNLKKLKSVRKIIINKWRLYWLVNNLKNEFYKYIKTKIILKQKYIIKISKKWKSISEKEVYN